MASKGKSQYLVWPPFAHTHTANASEIIFDLKKTADKTLTVMDWPPVQNWIVTRQCGITWTEKEIKDSQGQSKE